MNLFWQRFKKNRLAVAGGILVFALFLVALFAPFLAPYSTQGIDREHILESPSLKHLMGTDDLGRDVLSRMIYGSRISLTVGFVAVGVASFIGIILGALAGYHGGWPERIIMRFIDIMLVFPGLLLILTVIAFIGPSIWNIMIVIGLTSWMGIARLVRAEFLSLKERDFVLAARALGAGDIRIMFSHIMINSLSPVFISAVFGVALAILVESSLSFLGFGVQPPTPSWGNILTLGKDNMEIAWWLSIYPGLAILVTVLGYNLLGEGLRDALDPRLWESPE